MRSLVLKEIQSFFSSLIGYTVVAVFLLFTSLFLWLFPGGWNVLDSGMASLSPFFAMAPWVLDVLGASCDHEVVCGGASQRDP
jgi:ABC-2 type transport system permease protein